MSVVASVMCRCLAEGRALPPPTLAPLIAIDAAGFLSLTCPRLGNEAAHADFERWRLDACEHLDMEYVAEKVTGSSRAWLKSALQELGAASFPALQEMNESDEGLTPPAEAAHLLRELRRFRELERFGERTVLFDSDTGAELAWCVRPHRQTLAVTDGEIIGLDAEGVFVERAEVGSSRARRFGARRLRQEISDPLALDRRGSQRVVVRLTDLDSAAEVELGAGIPAERVAWPDGAMTTWTGHPRFRYPRHLHVEVRAQTESVFEHVLTALENLFRASVELGHPVRWAER